MTDFRQIAPMLSGPAILDFAQTGRGTEKAIAKFELRDRFLAGRVDDICFATACKILGIDPEA